MALPLKGCTGRYPQGLLPLQLRAKSYASFWTNQSNLVYNPKSILRKMDTHKEVILNHQEEQLMFWYR